MTVCLAVGAKMLHLTAAAFTLQWTHSVEHVAWAEDWTVTSEALILEEFRIKGSGAGMEPGPDAVLRDGWWVSAGHVQVPTLTLAASGATGGGWTFCADGTCTEIGAAQGPPVTLSPCREGS